MRTQHFIPIKIGTRGGTWTHNLFRATLSKSVTYAFRHSGIKLADEEGFELSRPFRVAGLANLCGYRFATHPYKLESPVRFELTLYGLERRCAFQSRIGDMEEGQGIELCHLFQGVSVFKTVRRHRLPPSLNFLPLLVFHVPV